MPAWPDVNATVLPPAERTLVHMLQRQRAWGDRPLMSLPQGHWTHADASRLASARASALSDAGLRRGDRVALLCGNRPEFMEIFLGAGWMGAVTVPINTAAMGPQIHYFIANSGARLLVIEAQYLPQLAHAQLGGTALEAVWVIGDLPPGPLPLPAGLPCRSLPPPTGSVPPAEVSPAETLAILYTSGTTGPSKGVMCPHAQYYWWGVNSLRVLAVREDDVLCTTLPLFHINALNTFAQAMLAGCQAVFLPKFSASGFWPAMRETGATVVYLLGAMVPMLLAQPPCAAEREHRVRTGLGPGVPAAAGGEFAQRTGIVLQEGYGSTETNFVIATAPGEPNRGVMGRVLPGFSARVADGDDQEVPAGEAGELLLRADEPYAFATGYHGMPEKTVEAWRNLWFHTGDRVVREADGSLRFVDRLKDAIRRRGENISSWEVEQVLLTHPAVAGVAVYPVRSELAEDEVMAAVLVKPGSTLDEAELIAFCEPRLPYFAVPRYVERMVELPRTENGKVQKYKLRERGIGPATWDRGPSRRRGASAPPART